MRVKKNSQESRRKKTQAKKKMLIAESGQGSRTAQISQTEERDKPLVTADARKNIPLSASQSNVSPEPSQESDSTINTSLEEGSDISQTSQESIRAGLQGTEKQSSDGDEIEQVTTPAKKTKECESSMRSVGSSTTKPKISQSKERNIAKRNRDIDHKRIMRDPSINLQEGEPMEVKTKQSQTFSVGRPRKHAGRRRMTSKEKRDRRLRKFVKWELSHFDCWEDYHPCVTAEEAFRRTFEHLYLQHDSKYYYATKDGINAYQTDKIEQPGWYWKPNKWGRREATPGPGAEKSFAYYVEYIRPWTKPGYKPHVGTIKQAKSDAKREHDELFKMPTDPKRQIRRYHYGGPKSDEKKIERQEAATLEKLSMPEWFYSPSRYPKMKQYRSVRFKLGNYRTLMHHKAIGESLLEYDGDNNIFCISFNTFHGVKHYYFEADAIIKPDGFKLHKNFFEHECNPRAVWKPIPCDYECFYCKHRYQCTSAERRGVTTGPDKAIYTFNLRTDSVWIIEQIDVLLDKQRFKQLQDLVIKVTGQKAFRRMMYTVPDILTFDWLYKYRPAPDEIKDKLREKVAADTETLFIQALAFVAEEMKRIPSKGDPKHHIKIQAKSKRISSAHEILVNLFPEEISRGVQIAENLDVGFSPRENRYIVVNERNQQIRVHKPLDCRCLWCLSRVRYVTAVRYAKERCLIQEDENFQGNDDSSSSNSHYNTDSLSSEVEDLCLSSSKASSRSFQKSEYSLSGVSSEASRKSIQQSEHSLHDVKSLSSLSPEHSSDEDKIEYVPDDYVSFDQMIAFGERDDQVQEDYDDLYGFDNDFHEDRLVEEIDALHVADSEPSGEDESQNKDVLEDTKMENPKEEEESDIQQ